MSLKKSSLTFTVFAGYFLLAALGGFSVWFIYNQVTDYTRMTDRNKNDNRKLLLVGEAATQLYEAESQSRKLIQEENPEGFDNYVAKIDSIRTTLTELQRIQDDPSLDREIDSIQVLLTQKTANLQELLKIRARGATESYYSRVLSELEKVDEVFEDPEYEQRFRDLEPHQRSVLIRLLEYAKNQNPQPSKITVDSLVTSVKRVLTELEVQERRYRMALRNQENQLLANELQLNNRLRSLLSAIESEQRISSIEQVAGWQKTIESTSRTITFLGAASLLVILVFIFLVVRDISRSQRYRRQLESAKMYAETLLQSREQFMNTITHDIRSPLNAIVGYTGLLRETGLNKSQNRYLGQLKKSSDYLLHLVNDLLDLSRLEAGKMSIEKLAFVPKNLIEEAVESALPAEKLEDVAVEVDIAPGLEQAVITDPFRIKQILTNLVSNACKFTEEGKIEIKAWPERRKSQQLLFIMVRDTGIGISREQREKVFEEFSQEDQSIEKKYGGSGLGLAISRKLTSLLGGKIKLESEPGKGSTFLLEIPVGIPEKVATEHTPESLPAANPKDYAVLLVDDEPAQLGLLKELIKSTGMAFTTAADGEEALQVIAQEPVDLVLTDIQMPKMNGMELLHQIRKRDETKDLPVIALSGQPDVSPADYLEKGFNGSLLKPYSSSNLLKLLEDILKLDLGKKHQKGKEPAVDGQYYTLEEIRSFAGEDQQALNAILTAFIESTTSSLESLELAFKRKDYSRVASLAHKMLPMFRQLRIWSLVNKLEVLENSGAEAIGKKDLMLFSEEVRELLVQLRKEIRD